MVATVEFDSPAPKDGVIKLPDNLAEWRGYPVRVILVKDERPSGRRIAGLHPGVMRPSSNFDESLSADFLTTPTPR